MDILIRNESHDQEESFIRSEMIKLRSNKGGLQAHAYPLFFLPLSELNDADVNEACEGIHAVMGHLKVNTLVLKYLLDLTLAC